MQARWKVTCPSSFVVSDLTGLRPAGWRVEGAVVSLLQRPGRAASPHLNLHLPSAISRSRIFHRTITVHIRTIETHALWASQWVSKITGYFRGGSQPARFLKTAKELALPLAKVPRTTRRAKRQVLRQVPTRQMTRRQATRVAARMRMNMRVARSTLWTTRTIRPAALRAPSTARLHRRATRSSTSAHLSPPSWRRTT